MNTIVEVAMSFKEIADAKKCVLSTSDWDAYQVIIRTCLKNLEEKQTIHHHPPLPLPPQQSAGTERRTAVN